MSCAYNGSSAVAVAGDQIVSVAATSVRIRTFSPGPAETGEWNGVSVAGITDAKGP